MGQVGISHLARRTASTLSDGERQKMMIAKALAQQTPIIVLDEPTAFLDYPSKVETMLLLMRLSHEAGKAVFMSTHDFELALQTADTLWLMTGDGGIVSGSPRSRRLAVGLHRAPRHNLRPLNDARHRRPLTRRSPSVRRRLTPYYIIYRGFPSRLVRSVSPCFFLPFFVPFVTHCCSMPCKSCPFALQKLTFRLAIDGLSPPESLPLAFRLQCGQLKLEIFAFISNSVG
jgi:hypothetical protein